MNYRLTIFVAIACIFAGCGNKSLKQEQRHAWQQEQARLYDIPVPIMAEPDFEYTWSDEHGSRVLGFLVTADSTQELVDFYRANMVRHGWSERVLIRGREVLIEFEKPEKLCCVSVRPEGQEKMRLVLSVGCKDIDVLYT
ncbi:MAG: hypothetical protein AB7F19_05830 [Candidatus Babeliales bacterium]